VRDAAAAAGAAAGAHYRWRADLLIRLLSAAPAD
jgi:hypothetical protein